MMAADHEPEITINGVRLTSAQAMAVRVAVAALETEMGKPDALGYGVGRHTAKALLHRLGEVQEFIHEWGVVRGDSPKEPLATIINERNCPLCNVADQHAPGCPLEGKTHIYSTYSTAHDHPVDWPATLKHNGIREGQKKC